MRIGTRIMMAFGLVLALTLGLAWYSLAKQGAVRDFTTAMDKRDFTVREQLRNITQIRGRMRASRDLALERHLLRKAGLAQEDPLAPQAAWRKSKDTNRKLLAELVAAIAGFEQDELPPRRAAQWKQIRQSVEEAQRALQMLAQQVELLFELINHDELNRAMGHMQAVEQLRDAFDARVAEAERLMAEQVGIGREAIAAYYAEARTSILIALALTVALGLAFSITIQRSITRPLATFMRFVERVGEGDLTQQAPDSRRDELGDLARSLNRMVAGLRDVAGQSRSAAENLSSATSEILASAQQQAAGAAEQSAAVQQTTATMADISQSGAQISERAKQVVAAAEATSASSSAGLEAVQNTTATTEAIRQQAEAVAETVVALSEKTQAVGEIIATVNDIAEQSHLLALNAAIEAAAAGEHGRSFAVVAGEMKNLADQSKEATVQVRSILGDIQQGINSSVMLTEEAVKRVESGRQQAGVADRAIRQLTENIRQSVQAFQQIVAGSSQQQIGFDQVSQAVRNISLATEQAAASTRQSEKAAANLNALAQQLRKAVERYVI